MSEYDRSDNDKDNNVRERKSKMKMIFPKKKCGDDCWILLSSINDNFDYLFTLKGWKR